MQVWLLALLSAHNQNYGNDACRAASGHIAVSTPEISSTYWIEDSYCHFTLGGKWNGTSMAISRLRRQQRPADAGAIIYSATARWEEDFDNAGSGEPFGILPLYKSFDSGDDGMALAGPDVWVNVTGKAMVSFGTAEDPSLIFGGVVHDAYLARQWVYGWPAPSMPAMMYSIHAILLVMALTSRSNTLYDWFMGWAAIPLADTFNARYKAMDPATARLVLALSVWLDFSFFFDSLLWSGYVWDRLGNDGGGMFVAVFLARGFYILYLAYIIWETPLALGTWAPSPGLVCVVNVCVVSGILALLSMLDSSASASWALMLYVPALWSGSHTKWWGKYFTVPFVVGGTLCAHFTFALYGGRDALDHAEALYIAIPTLIFVVGFLIPFGCGFVGNGQVVYAYCVTATQFLLILFVGLLLNIGCGALGALCFTCAVQKRRNVNSNLNESPMKPAQYHAVRRPLRW